MRLAVLRLAPLALLTVAPWRGALAQTLRVHGIVLDSAASRPLSDVRIHVRGTQWTTHTGADGRFRIPVPATRVVIVAQRLGYGPAEAKSDYGHRDSHGAGQQLRRVPK